MFWDELTALRFSVVSTHQMNSGERLLQIQREALVKVQELKML
jgi:hypothetical protein